MAFGLINTRTDSSSEVSAQRFGFGVRTFLLFPVVFPSPPHIPSLSVTCAFSALYPANHTLEEK